MAVRWRQVSLCTAPVFLVLISLSYCYLHCILSLYLVIILISCLYALLELSQSALGVVLLLYEVYVSRVRGQGQCAVAALSALSQSAFVNISLINLNIYFSPILLFCSLLEIFQRSLAARSGVSVFLGTCALVPPDWFLGVDVCHWECPCISLYMS